ncbi:fibronectin type III domain-containing protein, partial [Cellulosimicrobium cellulans]|uniref:fibronectin type III domain-containing protein n=1 Tax=Cellulosimicrobium cellulans TaxID=1710 RepID=UPI001963CA15
DGLTNNVKYTFTVYATNAVGDGPASPPSAEARPDEKPDPPAAPTLEFGDKSLTVTWTNKTYTDRSPIETVDLEISPAPPGGAVQKTALTGTSVTWDGLQNGVAYKVRVRANNLAPDPSDWGEYSAAETPAGKPAAPGKPSAKRTSIGDTSQMQVSWTAPDDNGAAISSYTVEAVRGGSVVKTATAAGGATSATLGVPADTTGYTFRVKAHNKATDKFGDAEFSPASDPVRAFATPGTVSNLSADANGTNGQIQLSFGAASGNGVRSEEISYQYDAGSGWKPLGGDKVVGDLTNGKPYSIKVRAVADVDGAREAGAASTANSESPYGPIPAPDVSMSGGDRTISYSWSTSDNGRDYTVSVRGAVRSSAKSGSGTLSVGYSETREICVTVTPTEGAAKETCRSATSDKKPEPVFTVSKGSNHKLPDGKWPGECGHSSCAELYLTIKDGPANTSFRVTCYGGGSRIGSGNYSYDAQGRALRTDGNGNYSGGQQCVWGQPGSAVRIDTTIGNTNSMTWY